MRLEVNFLHFLTLLGVKIWKIVHMICVESEFDDFAKGSGQMKVIGKIIILLSFIFNSLSPALVYAAKTILYLIKARFLRSIVQKRTKMI